MRRQSGVDSRGGPAVCRTASPSISFHGLGVTEHIQGTEGVMCLVNLALLTGNIGKPGHGHQPAARPEQRAGVGAHGLRSRNSHRKRFDRGARGAFESVWGASLPTRPGLNLLKMIDSASSG